MAPMVATVAEAADFADKVRARGLKAGVMVEVPSAALLAHRMLEVVDFLSIGTNDLTQYTMAADRMATDLAHLTDPWQPAVLQLIAITAEAGKQAGKPVGVCGEAAADPLLAMRPGRHGHHVAVDGRRRGAPGGRPARRGVAWTTCEDAAEAALAATDPMAARAEEESPAPTVLTTVVGGGVACQAPSAVTRTAPLPPRVASTAPTPRSMSCRGGARGGDGVGLELVGVASGEGGQLLAVGLHQVGRGFGQASTSACSGASLVSTATCPPTSRSRRTSSA